MIEVPVEIKSASNLRESWQARHRRAEVHKEATAWALQAAAISRPALPVVVKLTRVAWRKLDDDNAIGGMKHVRDAVADWLGVNDGDTKRVRFEYAQAKGAVREFACRIEFFNQRGE